MRLLTATSISHFLHDLVLVLVGTISNPAVDHQQTKTPAAQRHDCRSNDYSGRGIPACRGANDGVRSDRQ